MSEDLSVVFWLHGLCGCVYSDRATHVRLFSRCRAFFTKQVLICDGVFVESPFGMGTELLWRLRYAHGTPTLRSLSIVSQHSHIICSKEVGKLMVMGFSVLDMTRVSMHIHLPRFS